MKTYFFGWKTAGNSNGLYRCWLLMMVGGQESDLCCGLGTWKWVMPFSHFIHWVNMYFLHEPPELWFNPPMSARPKPPHMLHVYHIMEYETCILKITKCTVAQRMPKIQHARSVLARFSVAPWNRKTCPGSIDCVCVSCALHCLLFACGWAAKPLGTPGSTILAIIWVWY